MNSRESILQQLRAGQKLWKANGEVPLPALPAVKDLYADAPSQASPGELVDMFEKRLIALKGECFRVSDKASVEKVIMKLIANTDLKDVLVVESPLLDALFSTRSALVKCFDRRSERVRGENQRYSQVKIAITTCDALIARTGSVGLRSISAAGRRASVLPEFHIVIATRGQVRESLEPWLREISTQPEWSYGVVISGPSRTADIEKILVLGAHGPKRLAVIVID